MSVYQKVGFTPVNRSGNYSHEIDFKVIRRKGTIVFVGNASGVVPPISPLRLAEKNVKIARPTYVLAFLSFISCISSHAFISLRNYIYTPEEAQKYTTELHDLVATQKLNVRIHAEYPFTAEGVQQAERDLTGGKTVGKLLIKIADE